MSRSDVTPPRFFVGRSHGSGVVPARLREAGYGIQTMRERYGEQRAQAIADVEGLEDVGAEGLVVLMKDKKIRTRPAEQSAVREHGVRCFCVASGNLTGPEMAQLFIDARERIVELCREDGPFIHQLSAAGVRRVL